MRRALLLAMYSPAPELSWSAILVFPRFFRLRLDLKDNLCPVAGPGSE